MHELNLEYTKQKDKNQKILLGQNKIHRNMVHPFRKVTYS